MKIAPLVDSKTFERASSKRVTSSTLAYGMTKEDPAAAKISYLLFW